MESLIAANRLADQLCLEARPTIARPGQTAIELSAGALVCRLLARSRARCKARTGPVRVRVYIERAVSSAN